jgi:hypothetical protein
MLQLIVAANVVPSSLNFTLKRELLHSSEMSVLTRVTWRHISEHNILHSHCHENLKFYMKVVLSYERLVNLNQTIWHHISVMVVRTLNPTHQEPCILNTFSITMQQQMYILDCTLLWASL